MQVQQRPSLAVAALAEVAGETDLDVQGIITDVNTIRSRPPRDGEKRALAVLAATAMTPEEIAGAVYYVRDRHDRGAPIEFRRE